MAKNQSIFFIIVQLVFSNDSESKFLYFFPEDHQQDINRLHLAKDRQNIARWSDDIEQARGLASGIRALKREKYNLGTGCKKLYRFATAS